MAGGELPDAGVLAYQFCEAAADQFGDDRADSYLTETVREVMELAPAVRERVVADLLGELVETMHRRGEKGAARVVTEIENDWRNDA